MSDWVLHFIHDRNSVYEVSAEDLLGKDAAGMVIPAHTDSEVNKRFETFFSNETDTSDIESDASAFWVMRKILDQGLLKSGWSFRGGKATIYGPKSAVCFTEMPLSGLVAYALSRDKPATVAPYAVGLLKSELFAAGGRPVIYGVTGEHKQIGNEKWPRFLAPSCGLAESEQYRYVVLGLQGTKQVDWTHEREWRWADHQNRASVPGLPVWRGDESFSFSRAVMIVENDGEVAQILSDLRRLTDNKFDRYDNPYNVELLQHTAVISLEELRGAKLLSPDRMLGLDDIPHHFFRRAPKTLASASEKTEVQGIVEEALVAASAAAAKWREGGDRGGAGFAELVIDDANSRFTQAALELGLVEPCSGVHPFGPGGYWLKGLSSVCKMQGIGEAEAAAEAAREVIARRVSELSMHVWTRDD